MPEDVEDIDRGWNQIVRDMTKAGMHPKVVDIGITGKDAGESHETTGAFGKSFVGFPKEKLTNAAVAAFHEYGTKGFSLGRSGATAGGAPERSFIRATIDEKHSDIDRLFQRVAKGAVGGKVKIEKGIKYSAAMWCLGPPFK